MQYVERVASGEEPGPHMSKDEWRKKKQKVSRSDPQPVKVSAMME